MPEGQLKNLPHRHKRWLAIQRVQHCNAGREGAHNMKIRHMWTYLVMAGGILLSTGVAVQAQLGGGSSAGSPGGDTIGQGRSEIPRPGTSGEATQGGAGNSGGAMNQNRHHDRTPSGPMDQGRPESARPGLGGNAPLGGRGADSSGGNPRIPGDGSNTGSGSMGIPGGSGSSGGMGSGGALGGSGGAGGGGK